MLLPIHMYRYIVMQASEEIVYVVRRKVFKQRRERKKKAKGIYLSFSEIKEIVHEELRK